MSENYPSNSRRLRQESEGKQIKKDQPEKKVEKVISGEAVIRKPSLGKRFFRTFGGGEDARSVGQTLLNDILVPVFKDTITTMVSQGFEQFVYGEVRSRGGANRPMARVAGQAAYTAYNRMSAPGPGPRPELSRRARAQHDFNEIILPTRADAQDVLGVLYELVSNFDVATVADLYEAVGQTSHFTDAKWGWNNLQGSSVQHVKGGFLLDLPRPEPIE